MTNLTAEIDNHRYPSGAVGHVLRKSSKGNLMWIPIAHRPVLILRNNVIPPMSMAWVVTASKWFNTLLNSTKRVLIHRWDRNL